MSKFFPRMSVAVVVTLLGLPTLAAAQSQKNAEAESSIVVPPTVVILELNGHQQLPEQVKQDGLAFVVDALKAQGFKVSRVRDYRGSLQPRCGNVPIATALPLWLKNSNT